MTSAKIPASIVVRRVAALLLSYLLVRLAFFIIAVVLIWQLPGGWKWVPLLAAIPLGVWVLLALVRDLPGILDFLGQKGRTIWRWVCRCCAPDWRGWRLLEVLGAGVLLLVAASAAWPLWAFMAQVSLREDETLNVAQYTSQGFTKAMTNYSLARNHILFNVVSSVLPWADSVNPLRARLVSFVAVFAGLALLVLYAGRRGWWIAGIFFAGLVATNPAAMQILLEARGYGVIFLCGVAACVGFAQWAETSGRGALALLALATTAGAYTLPYFLVFGGGLLLLAFLCRPNRRTLSAGILAAVATTMLYLPVLQKMAKVALDYGSDYAGKSTNNYDGLDGILNILGFGISSHALQIGPSVLFAGLAGLLAFVALGRCATASTRLTLACVAACILGTLAFFAAMGSVPVRTGAFLAGPLAFCLAAVAGSLLTWKVLEPVRGPITLLAALAAVAGLWQARPVEDLVPRQDWRGIAAAIERFVEPGIPLRTSKSHSSLLEWHFSDRRKPHWEAIDAAEVAAGRLVVIDTEFQGHGENKRPGWADLPAEIRFVTIPLLNNYNRIYFQPPDAAGILGIFTGNEPIPTTVPGHQYPDPGILARSHGHGDTLLRPPLPEGPWAQPRLLEPPFEIMIEITPEGQHSTLNLLFSRALDGTEFIARYKALDGNWHPLPNLTPYGEALSIPLPKETCLAVGLTVEPTPDWKPQGRPPLGLLAAWVNRPIPDLKRPAPPGQDH